MIKGILPASVVAEEAFDDLAASELFPEEEALVARSTEERKREFSTVRISARKALARLGFPPVPILPGVRGEPNWPANVVGSMTHCVGYRAAAVAHVDDMLAIGVDAEPNCRIPDHDLLEAVTIPEERLWLPRMTAQRPDVCWDRLVFSAKESVYKAWYPLTGRKLEFEDVLITVNPTQNTFRARLLVPGPILEGRSLTCFDGHWIVRNGLIVTSTALPRESRSARQPARATHHGHNVRPPRAGL